MNLKEIEQLEYNYLRKIDFDLSQDLSKMIEGLNSKDRIKSEDFIWRKDITNNRGCFSWQKMLHHLH